MRLAISLLVLALFLPPQASAQSECRVTDLKIGSARTEVLSALKSLRCELKLGTPDKSSLEDDIVIPEQNEKYAYFELIFLKEKLASVWSYSPLFNSAEQAFSALYQELLPHSTLVQGTAGDALGERDVATSKLFLRRPASEIGELKSLGFDVATGTVFLELRKNKQGSTGVRLATVRTK